MSASGGSALLKEWDSAQYSFHGRPSEGRGSELSRERREGIILQVEKTGGDFREERVGNQST